MKVNKKNKRLVLKFVRQFCKRMKIGIPDIALDVIYARPFEKYDYWAKYIHADDLLVVNLETQADKTILRYSIAHELTHKKHPRMEHGDKFTKLVDHYFKTA